MGRSGTCIAFIALLLVISGIPSETSHIEASRSSQIIIEIDGLADLLASTYLHSGNGSSGDPYVIRGFPSDLDGLVVKNISGNIVIKDHVFYNNKVSRALLVVHCFRCLIENITIMNYDEVLRISGRTNISINNSFIRDIPKSYTYGEGDIPFLVDVRGDLEIRNSTLQATAQDGNQWGTDISAHRVNIHNSTFKNFPLLPIETNTVGYLDINNSQFIGCTLVPINYHCEMKQRCYIRNSHINNSRIDTLSAYHLKIFDNLFTGYGSYILYGDPLPHYSWAGNEVRCNRFEGSRGLISLYSYNSDWVMNWDITENYFANSTYPAIDIFGEYFYNVRIWKNIFYHNRGTGDDTGSEPQVRVRDVYYESSGLNFSNERLGNYWRDKTGPDMDNDGYVDDKYIVDDTTQWGGSKFYDHFPVTNIWFDTTPPSIQLIGSSYRTSGNGYNLIEWEASDIGSGLKEVLYSYDGENWTVSSNLSRTSVLLEKGTHSIFVKAVDRAGLYNITELEIEVLTSVYPLEIENPGDGEYLREDPLNIRWTVDNDVEVYRQVLMIDETEIEVPAGTRSYDIGLPSGAHSIDLICMDRYGLNLTDDADFTMDMADPLINIISPGEGVTYSNKNIKLVWNVEDANGIAFSGFRLDTEGWIETIGKGPYSRDYVLSNGNYTFEVSAVDMAGSTAEKRVNFSIGPVTSMKITDPADGDVTRETSIDLKWDLIGDFIPSRYVVTNIDGDYVQEFEGEDIWSVPLIRDSRNRISLRAYDLFDNYIEDSIVVIRDNTDPVITIQNKTDVRGSRSDTIFWLAFDTNGISSLEYRMNNGDWNICGYSYEIPDPMKDGYQTIEVRCLDPAGNSGSDVYNFKLDRTPPAVKFDGETDELFMKDPVVDIGWSASDSNGIDEITLDINGRSYEMDGDRRSWEGVLDDGYYVVNINVTDAALNNASDSLIVHVDSRKPDLKVLSDVPDLLNIKLYHLYVEMEDNYHLDRLEIMQNGIRSRDIYGNGTVIIPLPLVDGENKIELTLFDMMGWNVKEKFTINVDTGKPLPGNFSHRYRDGILVVEYSSYDPGSGIFENVFMIKDEEIRRSEPQGILDLGMRDPGPLSITWIMVDKAGNNFTVIKDMVLEDKDDGPDERGPGRGTIILMVLAALVIIGSLITFAVIFQRKRTSENIEKEMVSRQPEPDLTELKRAPPVSSLGSPNIRKVLPPPGPQTFPEGDKGNGDRNDGNSRQGKDV